MEYTPKYPSYFRCSGQCQGCSLEGKCMIDPLKSPIRLDFVENPFVELSLKHLDWPDTFPELRLSEHSQYAWMDPVPTEPPGSKYGCNGCPNRSFRPYGCMGCTAPRTI